MRSPQQKGRIAAVSIRVAGENNQRCGPGETSPSAVATRRWGVILAGGDGVRLRGLTRLIWGDDRPKQFCPLLGEYTLLEEARRRAEQTIYADQILFSVTRAHQDYYLRDLGSRSSQRIVQPCNKGTAPAILLSLFRIAQMDRDAVVAILPSDHYFSDESVFTAVLESAFEIAEALPKSVVLLGAEPKRPAVEYGWIEVGGTVRASCTGVFRVRGFQEKPPLPIAKQLLRSGALWNTFVMVGHVNAFLEMAAASVPDLLQALRSEHMVLGPKAETRITDSLYDPIAPTDFSRAILSPAARRLLTLRLSGVEWDDLGDPNRVISVLFERDVEPPVWAMRWRAVMDAEPAAVQCMSAAVA